MKNRKSTKRALISSVLALVLCFSMLVGTTFAWFTDSVTSANNIIMSGNLDVELYFQVEGQTDWTKVTENTNIFKENALWEPGHTEVVKLKVVNEGSLALKYNLGVNVASEIGSVNANGEAFKLSEYIKFAVIDGAQTYTRDEAIVAAEAAGATALTEAYNSGTATLLAGKEAIVTMVVYMPTEVGNDANAAKGAVTPTINLGINLSATQVENEEDAFGNDYDKDAMTFVATAAEAQAALDNATEGTTIKLAPGVDYGTLYLRPVAGSANTITDCDYLIYGTEMLRKVENLTIVGAEGATVDAIVTEAGYVKDSGSTGYVVDIKNLVIDSVNFTDDYENPNTAHKYSSPLFFDLTYINVDGLTVKNCSLMGDNDMMNFVYFYGSGAPSNSTFVTAAKNITITNNIVDGIARLCELRQAENVTITNNTIKNTALHGVLLPVDGGTYSGNITITGNTAEGINERFVRADGMGDAVVVIKDNTLINYMGADANYIKVTNANNVTIENNTLVSIGVKDAAAAQKALDNAVADTTIQLQPGVNYGILYLRPVADGAATKDVDWIGNNYGWETYTCFENLTIIGAEGATVDAIKIEGGTYYHTEHSQDDTYPVMLSLIELKNVVFDGVTFTGKGGYDPQGYGNAINLSGGNIKVDGLTLKNCVLENEDNNARLIYKTESTSHVHNYAYNGESFTFVPSLKNITVTGCTFNGGYMGLELRETENLTITNNTFNVADRNILLPTNTGCTYSGTITITGNVSNNAKERFVRADGMGDAVVVIKDNTLNNYMGADADYIKVTNANNVTVENNTKN